MQRFSGLEWVSYLKGMKPIIIGGVGGIGSYLTLWLSRLELDLIIYDDDVIEKSNISGQHYRLEDIGDFKTSAIARQVQSFSNNTVECFGKYDKSSLVTPVMFSAFDNMKARQIMFDKWKQQDNKIVFIDGRMLAESFEIYIVDKAREQEYEHKYLFDDNRVANLACSTKATTHCGAIIGGFMVAAFTNYLFNYNMKGNIRSTPFKLIYDLELFNQTTIEDVQDTLL